MRNLFAPLILTAFGFTAIAQTDLTVNMYRQAPSCFGSSDGWVAADVTGGNAPYTYMWNTAAFDTAISGVSSGYYEVSVSDAMGTTVFSSYTLSEPMEPGHNTAPEMYPNGMFFSCETCQPILGRLISNSFRHFSGLALE